MTNAAGETPGGRSRLPLAGHVDMSMSTEALASLRWHLDRYDRLRASTSSRAAVVLSAGALLSAANAVVVSQLLGSGFDDVPLTLLASCAGVAFVGVALVVLAVVQASGVLVTLKASRSMFAGKGSPPVSLLFNGTDTVRQVRSFEEFSTVVDQQQADDILEAAKAELWIVIHQHRYRYERLRRAVRVLRYAAITLLVTVAGIIIVNLLYRP